MNHSDNGGKWSDSTVAARLVTCERQIRSLRGALTVASSLLVLCGLTLLSGFSRGSRPTSEAAADSIRTRELIVADDSGRVRARIGGHLPDAIIDGRRVARGENAAGVLLYDRTGTERGGYVTFDGSNVVGLTLDNHGNQAAIFAAGPDPGDGATMRVWRERDWGEIKADQAGPHVTVGRNGAVAFVAPEFTGVESAAVCTELKTEVARVKPAPPASTILAACKAHAPDGVCRKCLGAP